MTDQARLHRLIKKAAKSSINAWGWDQSHTDDLIQDMWTEYLAKPSNQDRIGGGSDELAYTTLRRMGDQLLTGYKTADDLAAGDRLYSSEAIKAVLKQAEYNPYLKSVVHLAVARLADRHPPYAEALKRRYIDGLTPKDKPGQNALTRAHQALAEEVHVVIVEMEDSDRTRVDPDAVRAHSGPATPTEDVALLIATNAAAAEVFADEAQDEAEAFTREYVRHGTGHTGVPIDIFDPAFNGMAGVQMYRSWVIPESSTKQQPQPLLANWSPEDLGMYVGSQWTPGYNRKEAA
ncbi:hypothetical protein [Mycolicibacterium houstonense]|uniref:hypothetical protein n=1 Tax=Mycolicibacterium houstonense TaxID=146021 RepID=UPI000829E2CD|nr:hypothetical protein [Mycolicibacterium houstonense]